MVPTTDLELEDGVQGQGDIGRDGGHGGRADVVEEEVRLGVADEAAACLTERQREAGKRAQTAAH